MKFDVASEHSMGYLLVVSITCYNRILSARQVYWNCKYSRHHVVDLTENSIISILSFLFMRLCL